MEKIGYLKGLAKYLSKNGRVEEAITRYQKALQICVLKNKLANYA
jgi:Flp pilus assembly protein TadD